MTKQEKIREGIVVRLIAADEEMTVEEATGLWGRWKANLKITPQHFGDCTGEPQTCIRCLIEDYYKRADALLEFEASEGVVIKVKEGYEKLFNE